MKKARHVVSASGLGLIIFEVSDVSDAVFNVGSSSGLADPFLRMNRRRLQKGRPRRPRMEKARHTDASGLGDYLFLRISDISDVLFEVQFRKISGEMNSEDFDLPGDFRICVRDVRE